MQGSTRWALFTLSAVGFVAISAALFQLLGGQVTGVLQQNLQVKKEGFVPYEERRQCAPACRCHAWLACHVLVPFSLSRCWQQIQCACSLGPL